MVFLDEHSIGTTSHNTSNGLYPRLRFLQETLNGIPAGTVCGYYFHGFDSTRRRLSSPEPT
jgi:hypothetical protein